MNRSFRQIQLWTGVALLTFAVGCGEDTKDQDNTVSAADDLPPLMDASTLLPSDDGYAQADKTDFDGKFDITVPASFDLLETQSPVRNQRSRGVCSIFSTIGLMEHLYIKEGTITTPDFSEQYLQWSAKVEAKGFQNVGGSSAKVNLDAIHRFGIVEESVWPYEPRGWGEADDPDCKKGEKNLPTKCYTNGDPSDEVRNAKKWTLPRGRWQSSRPKSLKTYMFKNKTAVVVGMTFFYQSWNHGGSELGINADNKAEGIVVYPSEKSKELSLKKRAGHSILLVGWDDNKTAPRLDEDGKPLLTEDGEPVLDKGFFLFKNSWGTGGSWGAENAKGKGYGWLSYRYVEEYGRAMSAGMPKVEIEEPKVEICGDGIDNDGNNQSDCDDAACAQESMCQNPTIDTRTYTDKADISIPDNDSEGIKRSFTVDQEGVVEKLILTVDITHSWIGDLSIILEGPNGDLAIVKENDDSDGDDLKRSFTITNFDGKLAKGEWNLYISDEAKFDEGKLIEASITLTSKN